MIDAGYYVEVTSSQLTSGPIGIVPECKHPGFCLKPSRLQRTNPVRRSDSFRLADDPLRISSCASHNLVSQDYPHSQSRLPTSSANQYLVRHRCADAATPPAR